MNQDSFRNLQYGLTALSRWVILLLAIMLLSSLGLGWLLQSFVILLALIIVTPIIAFLGFQWWLSRNLVQDHCPVCSYEFTSLKQTQFHCPNCNEPLTISHGKFHRLTPPGTIDVVAVDVSAQTVDDSRDN